jgi:hypothetical protein
MAPSSAAWLLLWLLLLLLVEQRQRQEPLLLLPPPMTAVVESLHPEATPHEAQREWTTVPWWKLLAMAENAVLATSQLT